MGAAPTGLLRKFGYVEQEYYVRGTACRYRITDATSTAQRVDCGWPYVTRMLVRRPADPARFNGTAVVEWSNVSTGQDIDFVWAATHRYQMRHGYAEISLSAQLVGVDALKAWSPTRYGDLTLTAPTDDPAGGTSLDATGDVLSWDVLTQTIRSLRRPGRHDVLPGEPVRRVIAAGESQSALRLSAYYNSIDPLSHAVDGTIFYDAALPLRSDSDNKAISVASELGIGLLPSGLPPHDSRSYRRWEVAGTSHISLQDMAYVDPMVLRDGYLKQPDGSASTLTGVITGCSRTPAWSTVPTGYVLDSALGHVDRWVRLRVRPPHAPRLVRDPAAPPLYDPVAVGGQAPGYAVTPTGLTAGGIHLASYDYSDAVNRGAGTTGPGVCWLTGQHRFYSDRELRARYPHPRRYLASARRLIAMDVAEGFVLPADARATSRRVYRTYLRLRG